jgi:hypothetical protein
MTQTPEEIERQLREIRRLEQERLQKELRRLEQERLQKERWDRNFECTEWLPMAVEAFLLSTCLLVFCFCFAVVSFTIKFSW